MNIKYSKRIKLVTSFQIENGIFNLLLKLKRRFRQKKIEGKDPQMNSVKEY